VAAVADRAMLARRRLSLTTRAVATLSARCMPRTAMPVRQDLMHRQRS
jgi:hypothetical protein